MEFEYCLGLALGIIMGSQWVIASILLKILNVLKDIKKANKPNTFVTD